MNPEYRDRSGSAPPILVVVPCGRSKIWDRNPDRGAVRADEAYTGTPFRMNRGYAERFGDAWVILSAKYGFLTPETMIPGPYEVTFKRRSTGHITIDELRAQVQAWHLNRFPVIVVLGGKEYRAAVAGAFVGCHVSLFSPFAGLPLGKAVQATKGAIVGGHPGFEVGGEQADAAPD